MVLGALSIGCYEILKPHLSCLIPFLINELQHPNKFIRAISCWTLSRFTGFITIDNLSDNAFDLFKEHLSEILKRFLDLETIVQEAAVTAFIVILETKPEKIEPFLFDIFKILTNVFKKYSGNSLINFFEIFTLLTENFEDAFKNESLSNELVEIVIQIWNKNLENYLKEENKANNVSEYFDIIISLIKASGQIRTNLINNIIIDTLNIFQKNLENFEKDKKDSNSIDKDIITKCFDLLSNVYTTVPFFIKNFEKKNSIVEYTYKYLNLKEKYLNHYIIALLGDIAKTDKILLEENIDFIIKILIENLDFENLSKKISKIKDDNDLEKLSLCNNSCWAIGIFALSYPNFIKDYIHIIMDKLTKIISLPKLNKSLAQNVCIAIGRFSIIEPQMISKYLDLFLKQFCLSLRNIKHSLEKQEAFT